MLSNRSGKKLNDYVSDYVIFDLETTGTSCTTDEVVEISAIKVVDGKVVEEFSTLVRRCEFTEKKFTPSLGDS